MILLSHVNAGLVPDAPGPPCYVDAPLPAGTAPVPARAPYMRVVPVADGLTGAEGYDAYLLLMAGVGAGEDLEGWSRRYPVADGGVDADE